MKVAFIQFNPVFGEIEENIEKAVTLIQRTDAEIIVLPELFNTGYLITSKKEAFDLSEPLPGGKTTEELSAIARKKNVHIVAGLIERHAEDLFNSAVVISPSGYLGKYRKIHLFNEEKLWFQPGDLGFSVLLTPETGVRDPSGRQLIFALSRYDRLYPIGPPILTNGTPANWAELP